MKPNTTRRASPAVRLLSEYPHPPERVWRALTDPDALARWLLPTTFQPQIGKRFAFWDTSGERKRRKVQCQVVELDAPHRLAYTWQAEDEPLPTLVAWTLEPTEAGTRVTLEHIGPAAPFTGEHNGLTLLADTLNSGASLPAALVLPAPRRRTGRIVLSAAAPPLSCVSRRRVRSAKESERAAVRFSSPRRDKSGPLFLRETSPCTR